MKIKSIDLFPIVMPLKAVLTLPRGASRTLAEGKQNILVRITDEDGDIGWGEAGPSRRWSAETTQSCYTSIKHYLAPAVMWRDVFDIAGLHEAMNQELAPGLDPGQPIAKAAIDLAVHDLICRKMKIPLQSWLGAKRLDRVKIGRLVSAPTPEAAAEITREAKAEGYEGFKVKVGHDADLDAEVMTAVVEAAEGGFVWPDANQAYSLQQAQTFLRHIENLGVTLFEQPVSMADVYATKKLLSCTHITIALDEAAMGLPFVVDLIRQDAMEGMAIKVSKTGGIYYARQMCDLALNSGMELVGSGLMDAPIGFATAVHLYAAYGIETPVDLNGPQHIAEDYSAAPFPMEGQTALVPQGPGLGIEVDEDKLAKFALDLPF
ncbi:MAG: enolase C-terminal domain-like protein [Alphaproteobacteria bacterium]|nr:enolase C-terminal domain-like protein [Alphaproteobacteria bacterium]